MRTKNKDISPHSKKVLEILQKSKKPLTAYELLEKLRAVGVKAPQTVYRALESLVERGMVHRIQSLSAFIACHNNEEDHGTQFAVCKGCGAVLELHDHRICDLIKEVGENLKFQIEREMLEIIGLCHKCSQT